MSCNLIILYRKHYVFYRAIYNCTNRIHQALQYTYFISCFFKPNETVCDAFLDLFSTFFSLVFFFKLWLSLLLIMQKQYKNYERADSAETKKKIYIQQQKRICKCSFIYDVHKKSKVRTPSPLFLSLHKHPILI